MKKHKRLLPFILAGALLCLAATTVINLATQVTGTLALSHGGTNLTAVPGTSGQLLFNNAGAIAAEDPIVSYNYVNLFTTATATGTLTSAVTRVSTFSQTGTLYITWASITGSPATCTIQIKSADSLGNLVNNGSAISVAPANGTTNQTFTAAAALQTAGQMEAVYACGTYPTTGTLSLDFVPAISTAVMGTVSVNDAQVSGTATSVSRGVVDAGTQRVIQASSTPVKESGLTTTVQTVIGSAAQLDSYFCYNPDATVEYVQIFDISGTVTLGTSVAAWSIGVPATSGANLSGLNLGFANAIKVAATTTATGSTAPATALDCNFGYK